MKIGRNDSCPCGSGKKYKKCCLLKNSNPLEAWKENVDIILKDKPLEEAESIKSISFAVLDFIRRRNWVGACHATSAVMWILYKEFGVDAKLYLGEVKFDNSVFDHSWIEIDGAVYDLAISAPLLPLKISDPIVNGVDIGTLKPTHGEYGIYHNGLDNIGSHVLQLSVIEYMNGDPNNLLWKILNEIAVKVGRPLNKDEITNKYSSARWEYKR